MKPLHLASITSAFLFSTLAVAPISFAADNIPRIEIPGPSEEIVLFENGKETKRVTVEKNSKEGQALSRAVDKEVFKAMGVNTLREILNQKRWQEYSSEVSKRMKVKEVPAAAATDRVRFLDEKGALRKEIKIGQESKRPAMKDFVDDVEKNAPLNNSTKANLRKFRAERPNDKLKVHISRLAYINKPKSHLVLVENQAVEGVENSDEFFRLDVAGKLTYMDAAGKELWHKYFKDGERVMGSGRPDGAQISDDGNIIAAMTSASDMGPGKEQLHVFDKSGNEIFTYPKDVEISTAPRPSEHKISPNGRYLSYRIEKRAYLTGGAAAQVAAPVSEEAQKVKVFERLKQIQKTVFWDLKEMTTWESDAYLVYDISDDGVADVGNPWTPGGNKPLDLKPNLKRP